jgi:large subunit ribosomal protein L29
MGSEEREKRLSELRAELMKLRITSKARGKVENPSGIKNIKRIIARILTVNREEAKKQKA